MAQWHYAGFPPQFQQQQQPPPQQQQQPQFQQLTAQPTGFPGPHPPFQQQQQPGFLQAQPTGFPGQFVQRTQTQSFLNAPPPPQPAFLQTQPTGFPPAAAPLVAQPTGIVDPRLRMMTNTFMPINSSAPYAPSGAPQLAPQQGGGLQQSISQHNQSQQGSSTQQIPWALTKAEKRQYNALFRVWDTSNSGFLNGATALEVFGNSGLPKDELARIWTLADRDDRGKLNIAEFHVAMALIYRRLNGMPIPDTLPDELVPPSARDLDSSVDLLKDLLKNETRSRSPGIDSQMSLLKNRSFTGSSPSFESGRDATIYKHADEEPLGGIYKPRSRHVNRDDVRSRREDDSPSSDLNEMKRQLENTAKMLDRQSEADAARTAEDEALDREMDDLRYRVRRVQDDLDYVSRGPRSAAKDQERRKLEREMMSLMHERIPEVERKIKARDEKKAMQERQWARDRDRANDRFGRYDARDEYSRRYDDDDYDRPYSRTASRGSGYRDRSRDRYDDRERERERERERDREREKEREKEREREKEVERPLSPPSKPRTPAPKPTPSPAAANLRNMSAEERAAYMKAEAQRRVQVRMAALGVTPTASSPSIDSDVEDRLKREKKEAEEKVRAAEKQAEERERLRKERLESEKAAKEGSPTTPTSVKAPPAPAPPKAAPPAPKRAPVPPPPRKAPAPAAPAPRQPPAPKAPPPAAAPAPVVPPPAPKVDPEEERLRAREEAIKKEREARVARLKRLEEEEEEARREEQRQIERRERLKRLEEEEEQARIEEERYQARLKAMKARSVTPKPASPPPAPAPVPSVQREPVAKPVQPAVASPPVGDSKSTNPFSRLLSQQGGTSNGSATATTQSTNPWTPKPPTTTPAIVIPPTPTKSPAPPTATGKTSYQTAALGADDDEDWGDVEEREGDGESSSEDEYTKSREKRVGIAQQLFGRPMSAGAGAGAGAASPGLMSPVGGPVSAPPAPAPGLPNPPPPPPPPAAPPVAPMAPPAAPLAATSVVAPAPAVPSGPGDMGALLKSIQGGKKLRQTTTVDKSGPPVSGRVIGDSAPPEHIVGSPQGILGLSSSSSVGVVDEEGEERRERKEHRQSVDWFASRAVDGAVSGRVELMPMTREVDEEEGEEEREVGKAGVPEILVDEAPSFDLMADIDKSVEHRVRSLYAFEGEGTDDLSFTENVIIIANPSKSGGDWWFGRNVVSGRSGLFPKTYVEVVKPVKAKATYEYTAANADEMSFGEGEVVDVVEREDEAWWKAERGGVVYIVPASYLEVEDG